MNLSFNGTVKVLDNRGKQIESKKTTVDEDFTFLETIQTNYLKSKGLCDTDKNEYGIHTYNFENQPTGKLIVKKNDAGDTLLIVSKIKPNGNIEQTTLSNKEINKELTDTKTPGNYENIILRTAANIFRQLKEKVVLPKKAQQFIQEIEKAGFKNKPEARIHS